jgi:hypothetical protein
MNEFEKKLFAFLLEATRATMSSMGAVDLKDFDPDVIEHARQHRLITNGQRYPFAISCITTMQALGFELLDWWRRECIPTLFTNLKRRNNPDVCRVDHEDILVFSRSPKVVS